MASSTPAALENKTPMQHLRDAYGVYCTQPTIMILYKILGAFGEHPLIGEVKTIYNRLVQIGIPGLPHAAHAVILYSIFDTICLDAPINPDLFDRFHKMLTGLEQRLTDLPQHCTSNNALYNHIYGLFAACIIDDKPITPGDIARIFRNSQANGPIVQAFDNWLQVSRTVQNYSQQPVFYNIIQHTVRLFLFKAPQSQPHLLINIMTTVEKWPVHVNVAGHMATFGVQIDPNPNKQPVFNQCGPIPQNPRVAAQYAQIPVQRTIFVDPPPSGSSAPFQVLPAVQNPSANLPGQMPVVGPGAGFAQGGQAQQAAQHSLSPSSPRIYQPRRTVSLAQQGQAGDDLQSLFPDLAQFDAQGPRRVSAPQANGFDADNINVTQKAPQSRLGNQQTTTSGPQPLAPPPTLAPPSTPKKSKTKKTPARSGTRHRPTAPKRGQIKYDKESEDEDDEDEVRMEVPDDDPNDEDFVG
ncbi:hypothetical protein PRZ48_011351 [Zasmidium cellare]|uniref:Uncharacterized protein n=1 Tax=Zasmidium cellare TaxID=395010 RepID=A0ABR0E647_ZASCE|nr:hypothetical protein PRZ48_011351 [Zasmidium cellare]